MSSNVLPRDITSYDLLKAFAVVIMVIDHIGAYFFPEALWLRSVGRIGFPVWFFLVGYARGRDLPIKLLWGIAILTMGNFVLGMAVFPLNALVTIAFIRLVIDRVMGFSLRGKVYLWGTGVVLFALAIPTWFVFEYGTMGLITAMFGYLIRHKQDVNDDRLVFQFMIFALLAFVFLQLVTFGFTVEQFLFMAVGTAFVRMVLFYFKPMSYPELTQKMPWLIRWIVQLFGRRTLEIYVLHLLAFKLTAFAMDYEGYGFMDWRWI